MTDNIDKNKKVSEGTILRTLTDYLLYLLADKKNIIEFKEEIIRRKREIEKARLNIYPQDMAVKSAEVLYECFKDQKDSNIDDLHAKMALIRVNKDDENYGEKIADAKIVIDCMDKEGLMKKDKARISLKGTLKEIIEGTWEGYTPKIPEAEEMKNIIKSVNDADPVLENIVKSLSGNNLKEDEQKPPISNIMGRSINYRPIEFPLLLNLFGIPQNKTVTYMETANIQPQNKTGKYLRMAFLTAAVLLLSNTTCTKPYNEDQMSNFVTSINRDYNYIKGKVGYEKAKGFLEKIVEDIKSKIGGQK